MNPLLLPERALKFSMIPSILAGLKTERKKSPTVIRKLFIVFRIACSLKRTRLFIQSKLLTLQAVSLFWHI